MNMSRILPALLALIFPLLTNAAESPSHGRNYDESNFLPYTLPDPLLALDGPHGITHYDWEQYLNFADRHFSRPH